ncbi:hypothetical protein [Lactobacillus sp. PV012]|uniref:hypothetical protein n=1 Tax=Lactobacillus sp. PV012 TaxID=2594494 RepID=UPI0022407BF9|nr:hypothetical protein [Lactobacillus sp. PV012]QNQ82238.1 hypothetical protein FP433_03890 [Lactobacillus sp. PV012]
MKIKNVVKKVTIAAMLATPALGAFSHSAALAASWVPNSKYYKSYNDDDDIPDQDVYDTYDGASYRNFKRRSANIYVKDKSILPAVKKAIKLWAPKFKFKLVKSAKHASLNSAKYANIVVYDNNNAEVNKHIMINGKPAMGDGGSAGISSTRVYENKNPEVIKYLHGSKYQAYAEMHLTPKRVEFLKKNPGWQNSSMFKPKDWKKKAFVNHMNLVVWSKTLTAQGKVNAVAQQLGEAIGLGYYDKTLPNAAGEVDDLMFAGEYNYNKNWRVTQSDLDHIDWIYSHPYAGDYNTVVNSSSAFGL